MFRCHEKYGDEDACRASYMVMDDIAFQCGVRSKKSCVGIAFCRVSAPPPCDASAQVSDVDLARGKEVHYSTARGDAGGSNPDLNPNSLTDGIVQSHNNKYWRSRESDNQWVSVRFESTTCVRRIKMVARDNTWTTWSQGIIGQVLVGETWTQCLRYH